jgi:hypothetical protein
MSHAVHKEMMEGMNSNEHMFQSSRPCFFLNNEKLVATIERKNIERSGKFNEDLDDLSYTVISGIVENEYGDQTKTYKPDLSGKKMHPESAEKHTSIIPEEAKKDDWKKYHQNLRLHDVCRVLGVCLGSV